MPLHIGAGKVTFSPDAHDKITPRKSGTIKSLGVSRKSIRASIRNKNIARIARREEKITKLTAQIQGMEKAIRLLPNGEEKEKKQSLLHESIIQLKEMQNRHNARRTSFPNENDLPQYSSNENTILENEPLTDPLTPPVDGGRCCTRRTKRRHTKRRR